MRRHREHRARSLRQRVPYRVRLREVQQHRRIAVVDEVRRHDDRQVAAGTGRDQLAEVVLGDKRPPLRVAEWFVVAMDQHGLSTARGGA